jgi:hypothetical protein
VKTKGCLTGSKNQKSESSTKRNPSQFEQVASHRQNSHGKGKEKEKTKRKQVMKA